MSYRELGITEQPVHITAHGEGNNGYTNFHIYLMNAPTGAVIGPLEEIANG